MNAMRQHTCIPDAETAVISYRMRWQCLALDKEGEAGCRAAG
jgi:hypothetical protein